MKLFTLIAVGLLSLTLHAQTVPLDHFDGGRNITQGNKVGSKGTLAEILRSLEVSISGNITQSITNGDTAAAPSSDAVFDALALKLNTSALTSSITSGDTTHAPTGDATFQALALKLDSAKLTVYTSAAVVSGDATPTVAVIGLGASDTILAVTQSTAGANSLPLLGWSNQLADSLDLVYSADPGDGSVVKVLVLKP